MGKFTIERWRCDRCHVEQDQYRKPFGMAYSIIATENGEWAGGHTIAWKELCFSCNDLVGNAIEDMKAAALAAREARP